MGVCGAETEVRGESNWKPCAVFEGFEKRLELQFVRDPNNNRCSDESSINSRGLRALSRTQLNKILTAAQCTIVSEMSNEYCDSYVLSESSLFIYPLKIVVKTCGTTQLLLAIPPLLAASFQMHLEVQRCKYTRGTFMFPSVQNYPHRNFNDEVRYLQKYFGHLGSGGKAYVMGSFPNWHIYMAGIADDHFSGSSDIVKPTYTLEVCMTELDRTKAHQFFNKDESLIGWDMTKSSGIDEIIPHAKICDFAFNPCGYSMNALEGKAHSTAHVTPEDGYSYASFECMGYGPKEMNLQTLLDRIANVFKPVKFSLSVEVSSSELEKTSAASWGLSVTPMGYVCDGTNRQEMPCGSVVVFHTFQTAAAEGGGVMSALSPVTPLALLESHRHLWIVPALDMFVPPSDHSVPHHEWNVRWNLNDLPRDTLELCSRHGRQQMDTDMDLFSRGKPALATGEDPFYVMDLGLILRLLRAWESAMPRVKPLYAVKCNPDADFDVASKVEVADVRQLGVSANRVIFADPCKVPSHIADATKQEALQPTFDSETEVFRLTKYLPAAEVVLRIRAYDFGAGCPLGVRYGADLEECEILGAAKAHGLKVVGGGPPFGQRGFPCGSVRRRNCIREEGVRLGCRCRAPPIPAAGCVGGGFVSKGGTRVKSRLLWLSSTKPWASISPRAWQWR